MYYDVQYKINSLDDLITMKNFFPSVPMGIYIAGPMRNYPYYNFKAFMSMEDRLREIGIEHIINPARLDMARGFDPFELPEDTDWNIIPTGFNLQECIEDDVKQIVHLGEENRYPALVLLRGWEKSTGAKAEIAVANWMGISVFEEDKVEVVYVSSITKERYVEA
jgi:hypothetical protein